RRALRAVEARIADDRVRVVRRRDVAVRDEDSGRRIAVSRAVARRAVVEVVAAIRDADAVERRAREREAERVRSTFGVRVALDHATGESGAGELDALRARRASREGAVLERAVAP